MSRIAIIPARGGSKRIPRKNIKDFLGKPIIAYSIEAALQSKLFQEVMVSTDDEEIASVAKKFGAHVPFVRSAENSSDHATTASVLVEVLEAYKKKGSAFEFACCIYPTAPFVTPAHLSEGLEKLLQGRYDAVFPVVPFSYPILRGLHVQDGKVKLIWPEYEQSRSQDLPKSYHDAGQWYWFHVASFLKTRSIFTANSGALVLPETMVQDIDTEADWEMASLKMQILRSGDAGAI